jgi:hypothetical protein
VPHTEADYRELVELLDRITEKVGEDENQIAELGLHYWEIGAISAPARRNFRRVGKTERKKYASTLPIVGQAHRLPGEEGSRSGRPTSGPEQEKIDLAFRRGDR